MRSFTVEERRARLARRHFLVEPTSAPIPHIASSMVGLHATDPATVYLSAWARVPGLTRADLDRALYEERTLIKHLSMRRTLFVFTRDLLPAATAGPGARVADSERRRTVREVEASAVASDGQTWLRDCRTRVLTSPRCKTH